MLFSLFGRYEACDVFSRPAVHSLPVDHASVRNGSAASCVRGGVYCTIFLGAR